MADLSRKHSEQLLVDVEPESGNGTAALRKLSAPEMTSDGQQKPAFAIRRRSSGSKANIEGLRSDNPDLLQHLKHLGPSNAANAPKPTRINAVKIKPGHTNTVPDIPNTIPEHERPPSSSVVAEESHAPEGGIGEGLLGSAGIEASDGVHSLAVGYGTMDPNGDRSSWKSGYSGIRAPVENPLSPKAKENENDEDAHLVVDNRTGSRERTRSVSTIASLHSVRSRSHSPPTKRHTARSGSISENIVDVNGIKKIVLETTSSSDSEDKAFYNQADGAEDSKHSEAESANAGGKAGNKKKRKKRGKKKKGPAGESSETQPLLGNR